MNKFDDQYVKNYLQDRKLNLLGEYKNCREKVEIGCVVCGSIFYKTFDSIRSKNVGCNECAKRNKWTNLRWNYDSVANLFLENNCLLLEANYVNARIPLRYKCVCDNEGFITFDNFKRGVRCQHCKKTNNSGCHHWNWNNDREYIARKKFMHFRCSKLLRRTLKAFRMNKVGHTSAILGYTPKELYEHLKNLNQDFDACARIWTVDRIFPIKAFVEYNVCDVKLINSLDNLQPMKQSANSSKGSNYSKKKFEAWLKTKGVCYVK